MTSITFKEFSSFLFWNYRDDILVGYKACIHRFFQIIHGQTSHCCAEKRKNFTKSLMCTITAVPCFYKLPPPFIGVAMYNTKCHVVVHVWNVMLACSWLTFQTNLLYLYQFQSWVVGKVAYSRLHFISCILVAVFTLKTVIDSHSYHNNHRQFRINQNQSHFRPITHSLLV